MRTATNRVSTRQQRYPKKGTKGYNFMHRGKRGKRKETQWGGLEPDPENNFGFVYRVTDRDTGQYYLGKKQYWTLKPKNVRKHKRPDNKVFSKDFLENFKESDWKFYKTSSRNNELIAAIKEDPTQYDWEILHNCETKGELYCLEAVCILTYSLFLSDEMCYNGIPHVEYLKFVKNDNVQDIVKDIVKERLGA